MAAQKTFGLLSYWSSVTHATGPGLAAAHDATAIVLPAPGGPVITVRGPAVPSSMRLSRRGRGTIQLGTLGAVIFACKTRSAPPGLGRGGMGTVGVFTDTTFRLTALPVARRLSWEPNLSPRRTGHTQLFACYRSHPQQGDL